MNHERALMNSTTTLHRVIVHIVFLVVAFVLSDFFAQHRFSANVALGELPTASAPLAFTPTCARAAGCDTSLVHAPPFQYGTLVPWVIGRIQHLPVQLSPVYGVPPVPGFHYVEVLSVFLLFVFFRYYVSQFFTQDITSSVLCIFMFYSLVSLFILPRIVPLTYAIWFPWDVPSILFFTIGLVLLCQRKWWAYYPLFAIAALNKQTTVFLAVVYLFTAMGQSKPRSIVLHFSLQVAIWLTVLYGQYTLGHVDPFAVDLFNTAKWHSNMSFLSRVSNLPFLFSAFGYLWIPAVVFLPLIRESFVRRSMLATVPYVAAVMVAGDVSELRIYGEMAPIVLVAFFHVLKELSQQSSQVGENDG